MKNGRLPIKGQPRGSNCRLTGWSLGLPDICFGTTIRPSSQLICLRHHGGWENIDFNKLHRGVRMMRPCVWRLSVSYSDVIFSSPHLLIPSSLHPLFPLSPCTFIFSSPHLLIPSSHPFILSSLYHLVPSSPHPIISSPPHPHEVKWNRGEWEHWRWIEQVILLLIVIIILIFIVILIKKLLQVSAMLSHSTLANTKVTSVAWWWKQPVQVEHLYPPSYIRNLPLTNGSFSRLPELI